MHDVKGVVSGVEQIAVPNHIDQSLRLVPNPISFAVAENNVGGRITNRCVSYTDVITRI